MPTITKEPPNTPDAIALIEELDAYLIPLYPIESHHGYEVETLIEQGVHFFILRDGDEAAGCGGVQFFDGENGERYGELKRMYVRPKFRGRGFGKLILNYLEDFTREHGFSILRLETGISQPEAIGLYERMGFKQIPPFGDYQPDPLSNFYEKRL